jgi:hypothetical protein
MGGGRVFQQNQGTAEIRTQGAWSVERTETVKRGEHGAWRWAQGASQTSEGSGVLGVFIIIIRFLLFWGGDFLSLAPTNGRMITQDFLNVV